VSVGAGLGVGAGVGVSSAFDSSCFSFSCCRSAN
jgi:hypothetical protein